MLHDVVDGHLLMQGVRETDGFFGSCLRRRARRRLRGITVARRDRCQRARRGHRDRIQNPIGRHLLSLVPT
ncbi:Uncharacterised protein [Mycobacteroides abscessus subsp. abscessus]|nr:Uncharacterised protein [Mycobacteroides abscessus subsp. abscessus]SIL65404.1 Uncharacterised protein [Mycobacteroides abscessus subsp. abscessus]SKU97784.1 Uncharacterised protein [Mycobacteroides abscessus subsp. abscessus]SLD44030.1 Uncharacterised protein [Mycobacteroides abscessus subsp. massiliense]